MGDDLLGRECLVLGLLGLYIVVYWAWQRVSTRQAGGQSATRPKRYTKTPKPFTGLTHKPRCSGCEQAVEPQPPSAPPTIASRGAPGA